MSNNSNSLFFNRPDDHDSNDSSDSSDSEYDDSNEEELKKFNKYILNIFATSKFNTNVNNINYKYNDTILNDIVDKKYPIPDCIDHMKINFDNSIKNLLSVSNYLENFFPLLNNIAQVNYIDKITNENKNLFFFTKEFMLFYRLVDILPPNTKSVLRFSFYSKYLRKYVIKLGMIFDLENKEEDENYNYSYNILLIMIYYQIY